jgi:hypothetical protein
MTLRIDPRVVDQIVRFAARNPQADGDVLAEIARRFPDASWDDFSGAVNHLIMCLRNYVRLDAAERALVEPRREIVPRNNKPDGRQRRARTAQAAQMDLFRQVKGDRHG